LAVVVVVEVVVAVVVVVEVVVAVVVVYLIQQRGAGTVE
jgi:hypothetical protein